MLIFVTGMLTHSLLEKTYNGAASWKIDHFVQNEESITMRSSNYTIWYLPKVLQSYAYIKTVCKQL